MSHLNTVTWISTCHVRYDSSDNVYNCALGVYMKRPPFPMTLAAVTGQTCRFRLLRPSQLE